MKILTAVTAALLVACMPSTPQPSALEAAKVRWSARGFGDYQVNYQVFCFCPRELTRLSKVEVRSGVVTKVPVLESSEVLDAKFYPSFPTIDGLFTQLEKDLPLKLESIFQSVDVTFDPALGFPSKIVYTEKPIVADASRSYSLSDLKALE